ncbi:MAG: hypothetical protein COA93_07440 [Alphaproteobacteria bacterium]|nr:MAG: hypothetical protein COA93_07440 [Alphaproteobacteria bacterium]
MTIPILIILCLLGNWQVERLNWKMGLIEKLEMRYGLPPVALPATVEDPDDWVYRHVTVTGRFLHMREMPLYNAGPTGRPGYDLFTPLMLKDNIGGRKIVIINRGWVPENLKEQMSRPETINSEEVQITGLLRKSWQKERFAPENDVEHNLWFYADLNGMKEAQHLTELFPMFLYADKTSNEGQYPIGERSQLNIVNNHLDYAMTWYGLAIVLLVIYIMFNVRRREEDQSQF